MRYMIDEPSSWDSLDEWRDFLREMLTIPEQGLQEVRSSVKAACRAILKIEMRGRCRRGGCVWPRLH